MRFSVFSQKLIRDQKLLQSLSVIYVQPSLRHVSMYDLAPYSRTAAADPL